ncbi:MAG: HEAT repeat domain-containing protein [Armatimonadota bacterium]
MKHTVIMCLFAIMVICSSAFARLQAPLQLEKQSNDADVICVGHVKTRTIGVPQEHGASIKLLFHVDRVMKGAVVANSDIKIIYFEDGVDKRGFMMSPRYWLYDNMMVLLARKGSSYTFASELNCTMTLSDQHAGYVQTDDINVNLRSELRNSLISESKPVIFAALGQVKTLSGVDIDSHVMPLTVSPDIEIRAEALRACLISGKLSVLPAVMSLLSQKPADGGNIPGRLNMLTAELQFIKFDKQYFPLFADAMSASHPLRLRKAACYALRTSGDKSALPYLKAVLDDTNPALRYHAMMGMSAISGDHTHTMPYSNYVANPSAYKTNLDYWRNKYIE